MDIAKPAAQDARSLASAAFAPAHAIALAAPPWPVYSGILDALYRFGAGQDNRDRELFASAFSEDAEVDFVQPAARLGVSLPVLRGRDAIVEQIMSSLAPLATTHTVTNPRVTMQGETAMLWALVEAQHVLRSAPDKQLLLKNIYHVALSGSDSWWQIDRVKIETVWMQGDPAVLFPRG